jgi:predicted  nucleic acid-binding Zn-ribbon protein
MKVVIKIFVITLLIILSSPSRSMRHLKSIALDLTPCEPGVYDVTIQCGKDKKTEFKARLDARRLENPTGADIRGLVINNATDSNNCGLFTNQIGSDFINYRFSSQFESSNPQSSGPLYSSVILVKGVSVPFNIIFKYDEKWPYITNENFDKIVKWVNKNRLDRINSLSKEKNNLIDYATKYTVGKSAYDAASKSKADFDQKVKDLNTDVTKLKTSTEELQKSLTSYNTKIQDQQKIVDKANSDLNTKTSVASSALGTQQGYEKQKLELEGSKSKSDGLFNTLNNSFNDAWTRLKSTRDYYEEEMAEMKDTWINAFTNFEQNKNVDTFKASVQKCFSIA